MKAIIDPLFKDTRCVMSVSSRQFLFFFFAWENLQKKKKKSWKSGAARAAPAALRATALHVFHFQPITVKMNV